MSRDMRKVYVIHYGDNTSKMQYFNWKACAADMKSMLDDGWKIRGVTVEKAGK